MTRKGKWHDFEPGDEVPVDEIVEVCKRHIETPGAVDNPESKLKRLDIIKNCGHSVLIYAPDPEKPRWGVSPMNESVWQTLDGERV